MFQNRFAKFVFQALAICLLLIGANASASSLLPVVTNQPMQKVAAPESQCKGLRVSKVSKDGLEFTAASGLKVSIFFDANGRVSSTRMGDQVTEPIYDNNGKLQGVRDARGQVREVLRTPMTPERKKFLSKKYSTLMRENTCSLRDVITSSLSGPDATLIKQIHRKSAAEAGFLKTDSEEFAELMEEEYWDSAFEDEVNVLIEDEFAANRTPCEAAKGTCQEACNYLAGSFGVGCALVSLAVATKAPLAAGIVILVCAAAITVERANCMTKCDNVPACRL